MKKRLDSLKSRSKSDQAAALPMVIAVSILIFAGLLIIATSSLVNVKTSASTTGNVKAFTAAEAGRDKILAGLVNSGKSCQPTGSTTTEPKYDWKIYHYEGASSTASPPTSLTQAGVTAGCPIDATTHIMIDVTGKGTQNATKNIVSTYAWNNDADFIPDTLFKGAVVTQGNLSFNLFTLGTDPGAPATVIVNNGNFSCTGASNIVANIAVPNGSATFNGCTNVSNIAASGPINFENAIGVNGSACSRNAINKNFYYQLTNQIGITGLSTPYAAGCANMPVANVSSWVDYNPLTGPSSGTPIVKFTDPAYCRIGQTLVPVRPNDILLDYIQSRTQDTIIDLTSCPYLEFRDTPSVGLKANITLVAKSFHLSNFTTNGGSGKVKQLNYVVPDRINSTPAKPDAPTSTPCSTSNVAGTYGNINVNLYSSGSNVKSLFYTPCMLHMGGGTFRGQVYAGSVDSSLTGTLIYSSILPPNLLPPDAPGTIPNPRVIPTPLGQIE